MSEFKNISRRPYLLRAMHAWITDSEQTPYVVVDATMDGIQVPANYIQDGKIILNISYTAANALELGNEWLMFQARFSGEPYNIIVPTGAVLAVYSKETGQGLIFDDEHDTPAPPSDESRPKEKSHAKAAPKKASKHPHLRVVK